MSDETDLESRWYFEELKDGVWVSWHLAGFSHDEVVKMMELRKKLHPRAKLRLCHTETTRVTTRVPYRNRHEFSTGPF